MKLPEAVQIPYSTYQNLLKHLQVNAPTDGWAATLLQQLQEEAQSLNREELLPVSGGRKLTADLEICSVERCKRED